MAQLSGSDDLRHRAVDGGFARESLYWNLPLLEEKLNLMGYFVVEPDGSTLALALAFGDQPGEPLTIEVATGADFDGDLDSVANERFRVRQAELDRCSVAYSGPALSFSLDFEALHPAFAYGSHPNGCPPGTATERFEQGGRIAGSYSAAGRSGEFTTTGWRDHSWGPRDWKLIGSYKLYSLMAEPDFSVNFFRAFVAGEVYDNGFIAMDGTVAPLVAAEVAVEYDEDFHHRAAKLAFRDSLGRELAAAGEREIGGRVTLGEMEICTASGRFEAGGRVVKGHLEQGWPDGYRRHAAEALGAGPGRR